MTVCVLCFVIRIWSFVLIRVSDFLILVSQYALTPALSHEYKGEGEYAKRKKRNEKCKIRGSNRTPVSHFLIACLSFRILFAFQVVNLDRWIRERVRRRIRIAFPHQFVMGE